MQDYLEYQDYLVLPVKKERMASPEDQDYLVSQDLKVTAENTERQADRDLQDALERQVSEEIPPHQALLPNLGDISSHDILSLQKILNAL